MEPAHNKSSETDAGKFLRCFAVSVGGCAARLKRYTL